MLEGPELPAELEHVWTWFLELHAARSSGGFGSGPIMFSEIESWSRLTLRSPKSIEVDMIKRLDSIWLAKPEPEEE